MKIKMKRRKFFAEMRKIGFKKSEMQLTRTALSYSNEAGVRVTVPKWHETTFMITGGGVTYSGIFHLRGSGVNWGIQVDLEKLGIGSMLEVCLGLCNGTIEMGGA